MKVLDSIIRIFVLTQGTGLRWLREELARLRVRIPLTDGCVAELLHAADEAVWEDGEPRSRYVEELRRQLTVRARFVQRWTGSDEAIEDEEEPGVQALVRIARKYALPRRWKLSEPVVVEYRRTHPSYWNWASETDSEALPQS